MTLTEKLEGMNFYLQSEQCNNIELIAKDYEQNKFTFQALNDDQETIFFQFELSSDNQQCNVYYKFHGKNEWMIYDTLEDDTF